MGNKLCCQEQNVKMGQFAQGNIETHKLFDSVKIPDLSPSIEKVLKDKQPFSTELKQTKNAKVKKFGGDTYEGPLDLNNRPNGIGKMYKEDGSLYVGHFKSGVADGQAIYIMPDGSYYEGLIISNFAEGKGFYQNKDLSYTGEFHKNAFQGQGKERGSDYEFEGEFSNGRRVAGILKWGVFPDSYYYKGNFDQSGKFTGEGLLTDPKGVYNGNFFKGEKHGFGIYNYTSKLRYEGQYKNGVKSGKGKIINCDETIAYEGEFQNGLPHGKGYATDKYGNKRDLQWKYGIYKDIID